MRQLITAFTLLLAGLAHGATGDITGVEISPTGAEPYGACADITIEGFTTGKAVDFGSGYGSPLAYSDIGSATIVFTITSEGYDNTGSLGTVVRTVYATEVVRQEYPNEASDEEPAATSIRVALSDFVYDDDNTGAGKSGTAPTVTIAAAAIRNDGGSSETSNAATDLTCTNSSGLDYPEVIARWDRVAGVCTADRVTSAFTMAVRAYHRSGIACVVFDADGQTSSNNETSTATTRTATQRTGSGLYAEAYHSDTVALTSFTDDELIDLRFRAYPVVGDADSVRDSDNHTTATEECRGYNKATIVCDKDDDSSMFASVDITSGNDATGVVSGTLATAEASPYQHIGDAIEDGANVIYLEDGTHPAIGHTFTRVTTNEWIVVTHHPTNSSTAGAIVQVDTTRNYLTQRLQYKNVTFTLADTSSWMDGQAVGNFLRFTGVVFDDDTTGAPLTGVGYRSHATYLENCTGDMGEQEWDWRYFSTPHQYYNFDGCDFGTPATPGTSNRACSYEMVACKASTAALRFYAVHASTVLDHLEMSFNEIMDHDSTSTNVIDIANAATGGISIGAAIIGNVIEKTAATSALAQIAADSGGYDCNNILLFHNTFAGERINAGYNSSGSTALIRRNWAQKYNSFEEWNVKTDTFAPENANRTGNWPIVYAVGFLGNQYETTLFAGDYDGLDTQTGSAGYIDDNSQTTDSSGNGDYTPNTGSTLLARIPTGDRVVTIDLYGNAVQDGGDIGAIQVTGRSGTTDWVEFATAATTAGGGTVDWTSASNALTSLATAATADLGADVTSYALQLTDASAGLTAVVGTIDGIEIEVEATGEDDGTKELEDATVQLIISGSQTGDNKAIVGGWGDSSIETRDYGAASDTWTASPTAALVKANNFGVALQFINNGVDTALMSVYRVRVRVTYGGAGGTTDTTGFFVFFR